MGGDGDDILLGLDGRDLLQGGAGNDDLRGGADDDVLRGGDGNDSLSGNGGDDILLGEAGDDFLDGNGGRDLLIGGTGADVIHGQSDDDILIAGFTDHDDNQAALNAIRAEWTSCRSYAQRVDNLRNGGCGVNGSVRLNDTTVHDDGVRDVLEGDQGNDWFLYNADGDQEATRDVVADLHRNELASDIDFGV
jgi:Ca2+-binding RTX toxin-like protein